MNCNICSSKYLVAPHHHPRRSAGTKFGGLTIPIDDPRRLINLCQDCHNAIHKRGYVLDRWRDELYWTLDKVTEAPGAKDLDMLSDPEGNCVWKREYPPVDVDNLFSEVIERVRADAEDIAARVVEFLPYANPDHWAALVVEIAELGTRKLDRIRTGLRVNYYDQCFGWDEKGRPISDEQRKQQTAEFWGVGLTTVKEDLSITKKLGLAGMLADDRPRSALVEEARQTRGRSVDVSQAKKPVCPKSPDGKHIWSICGLCGADRWPVEKNR